MSVNAAAEIDGNPAPAEGKVSRSDDEADRRYVAILDQLLAEAVGERKVHIAADCLAWALARIVIDCGSPVIAGDVMRLLGQHVKWLAQRAAAQREADEARAAGMKPN